MRCLLLRVFLILSCFVYSHVCEWSNEEEHCLAFDIIVQHLSSKFSDRRTKILGNEFGDYIAKYRQWALVYCQTCLFSYKITAQ